MSFTWFLSKKPDFSIKMMKNSWKLVLCIALLLPCLVVPSAMSLKNLAAWVHTGKNIILCSVYYQEEVVNGQGPHCAPPAAPTSGISWYVRTYMCALHCYHRYFCYRALPRHPYSNGYHYARSSIIKANKKFISYIHVCTETDIQENTIIMVFDRGRPHPQLGIHENGVKYFLSCHTCF